jgi:hypothetical protein
MTTCNDVVGYECFGGPWCLRLQVQLNLETEKHVAGFQSFGGPGHSPPKLWYPATSLHGVMTHKTDWNLQCRENVGSLVGMTSAASAPSQ